ncbi:serine hydrolase [Tomitella fengzijianii]|uniref:Serine hydrolase n=1 Tax=Tomitella fengzijianii TaxID=2597660 RepID=A0A516X6I1_9ACTN|nr:serine hydrolase [Tomitella fengzijianii]QDQ98687.1 serine hydrolase [Tomitella fengzijianii]
MSTLRSSAVKNTAVKNTAVRSAAAAVTAIALTATGLALPAAAAPAAPDASIASQGSLQWQPARDRADRVLQIIGSDAPVDPVEALAMSAPSLTAALYPQSLASAFTAWQASGPFTVTGTEDDGPTAVTHLETARGVPATLTVHVGPVGLIDGITMLPDVPDAATFADVDAGTAAIGARVSLLAADADLDAADSGGQCSAVYSSGADEVMPLGSIFKLYVLGALGDAVAAGEIGWDDTLTITDDVKSLPSGELQNRPSGSTVTVREAAEKMISISDNTAADMLIHAVGRDRVEAAVRAMGDENPGALTPFPTTRELFIIGWGPDPSLRQRWADAADLPDASATEAERRAVLAEADTRSLDDVDLQQLMQTPLGAGDIGWYASAQDVCHAHVALQRMAAGSDAAAPIRGILAENPGVQDVDGLEYVAYKGGSTPGRLAGSWLVTGDDGDSHVLVFQMASDEPIGVIEQNYVFGLMGRALGMFG